VDSGELTNRSWQDYKAACDLIVSHFGKGRLVADIDPDDFAGLRGKMAKKRGPVTLGNVIQRIRVAFKFAWDNGLIDRPVRYGQAFKRPSRKVVRVDRAKRGPKLLTADEIRRLLAGAGRQLKAMILLGVNGGFGNADCGHLPLSAVDLEAGMIDFPRPKTGIPRRCPLWAETAQAIREASADRPEPKKEEHAGLVFITKYGLPWAKDTADQTLAKEFGKLLRALGICKTSRSAWRRLFSARRRRSSSPTAGGCPGRGRPGRPEPGGPASRSGGGSREPRGSGRPRPRSSPAR
jgi:integrase